MSEAYERLSDDELLRQRDLLRGVIKGDDAENDSTEQEEHGALAAIEAEIERRQEIPKE